MSKKPSKEEKQFQLNSREKCIVYLNKILICFHLVRDKLKRYIKEEKHIVEANIDRKPFSWELYCDQRDKSNNCISFLCNILGDAQNESISYFKYKAKIEKYNKNGGTIPNYCLTQKERECLNEMNRFRNWHNHIPESILISDFTIGNKADGEPSIMLSPVVYIIGKTVTYECFSEMYEGNVNFLRECNTILRALKKDYELLAGMPVEYQKYILSEPQGVERGEAQMRSMWIQGLDVDEVYKERFLREPKKDSLVFGDIIAEVKIPKWRPPMTSINEND